jgi:hypothetical protein
LGAEWAQNPAFPAQIERWPVRKGGRIKVNFAELWSEAMGIEPTSDAWEASNLTSKTLELAAFVAFFITEPSTGRCAINSLTPPGLKIRAG